MYLSHNYYIRNFGDSIIILLRHSFLFGWTRFRYDKNIAQYSLAIIKEYTCVRARRRHARHTWM